MWDSDLAGCVADFRLLCGFWRGRVRVGACGFWLVGFLWCGSGGLFAVEPSARHRSDEYFYQSHRKADGHDMSGKRWSAIGMTEASRYPRPQTAAPAQRAV